MSLQAALTTVPSKSCYLVPVVVSAAVSFKVRRASLVRKFSDGTKLGSVQHSDLRSHCLLSSTCFCRSRYTFRARNQPARLQATSLQAVTADNDSSNGDAEGSSACAMNLSREDWRPLFVSSLQGLQEGLKKLKERGLLQISKEGFEEAYSKLKTVDGKLIVEDVLHSKFVTQGLSTWQTLEPWIKWPLAIFASTFLVVLTTCGVVVAQDLIPLWIIGPLLTSLIIRGACWTSDFTRKFVASTEPLRESLIRGTVQLFEDAKNGELNDKLRTMIVLKSKELKEDLAKKRSDFVLYVKSGQATTDFKVFMLLLFGQLNNWRVEKYEDFAEWIRPSWRAFVRLMKKLF